MKMTLFVLALAGCHGSANKQGDMSVDLAKSGPIDAATSDGTMPTDSSTPPDATMLGPELLYASGYSNSIVAYAMDPSSGALTMKSSITATQPSYLAFNPAQTFLYAVAEQTNGQVSAFSIDRSTGALTSLNSTQSSQGQGPAFLSIDPSGKWVLVPNYTNGVIAVLPINADGTLGASVSTLTAGTNAHMMITDPSGKFVFVPCLGSDWVAQYVFDPTTGALTANATPHLTVPSGTGPRHLAFAPNGKFAYLLGETASMLFTLSYDATNGTLTSIESHSSVPPSFTGTNTAAEVHVHPSGKWVYTSNRGADDITRFSVDASTGKLTYVDAISSGGMEPRDFTIDPTGSFLYAANQSTGNVVPFKIAADGSLSTTGSAQTLSMASYAGVITLSP